MNKLSHQIFLLIVALVFCFSCRNVEEERKFIEPRSFDKQKWSDVTTIGVEATWEVRPGMARDLTNRRMLIGKNRSEIAEMLGEIFEENVFKENQMSYELEVIWGSNIDPIAIEYLVIDFDEENRVEGTGIYFYKTHDWKD